MVKENIKRFSNIFTAQLGELVKHTHNIAQAEKMTESERLAVISETFYLLGRHHKALKEKAQIV